MYRECYTDQKVTFDKRHQKRLTLHIPDAKTNCIPYPLLSTYIGKRLVIRSRKSNTSLRLCTDTLPEAVCDRIRLERLSAGKLPQEMADALGIHRSIYLRCETGQVEEHNMKVSLLTQIAEICGKPTNFCLNSYLTLLYEGVGAKLREYRKENKLTQQKLADQLGVAKTTVGRWEAEKDRPSPKYIETCLESKPQARADNTVRSRLLFGPVFGGKL